ncbi:secreted RxLR effector protein 161-like [Nicotiana tomentosiformis]|uniref:secreted RxLR effector protein 161-like n=1 Tax=Nicotiana tomentosiformis TaxID=4098 RepID=UPI00388C97CD
MATKLDMDEPSTSVDEKKYRYMIGSFLYLTASRPDMGLCDRFQSNPKELHLKAVKRILRYLNGSQDLIFWYPVGDSFDSIRYADANYHGYLVDRNNTLGSSIAGEGEVVREGVAEEPAEKVIYQAQEPGYLNVDPEKSEFFDWGDTDEEREKTEKNK